MLKRTVCPDDWYESKALLWMKAETRQANLQYVLWVTTYNIFFLLLYILHDLYFFPPSIARATGAAKQLGPGETAYAPHYNPPATNNGVSWTTALDQSASSKPTPRPPLTRAATTSGVPESGSQASTMANDLLSPGVFGRSGGVGSPRESMEEQSEVQKKGDGKSKKRNARKSWEGPELVLRRGFVDEDEEDVNKGETARSKVIMNKRGGKRRKRPEPMSPELLEAVNRNGLVVFLLVRRALSF